MHSNNHDVDDGRRPAFPGGASQGASRQSASVHSPLHCVADVFKIASGKLTLPGKVHQ
jgi:hypothetical protein